MTAFIISVMDLINLKQYSLAKEFQLSRMTVNRFLMDGAFLCFIKKKFYRKCSIGFRIELFARHVIDLFTFSEKKKKLCIYI